MELISTGGSSINDDYLPDYEESEDDQEYCESEQRSGSKATENDLRDSVFDDLVNSNRQIIKIKLRKTTANKNNLSHVAIS